MPFSHSLLIPSEAGVAPSISHAHIEYAIA